eukprot:332813-Prymnesium_polylepis.1
MLLTLAQFDDQQPFDIIHDGVDIRKLAPLRSVDFQPRGRTPLYDALTALSEQERKAAACAHLSPPLLHRPRRNSKSSPPGSATAHTARRP